MLEPDRLTCWLRRNGYEVTEFAPAAFLGAPPVGWRIQLGQSYFVYRIPEERPSVLLIVLFERDKTRFGLRSPFADFVKFLTLAKRSETGITLIEGHVDALRPGGDVLVSARIEAFYKKHLNAYSLGFRDGIEWVAGDLTKFRPPLGLNA